MSAPAVLERFVVAVRGFGRFLWDFVMGDDPVAAVGVAVVLAGAALLTRVSRTAAWLVVPAAVTALLALTLYRALGRSGVRRVRLRASRSGPPTPG